MANPVAGRADLALGPLAVGKKGVAAHCGNSVPIGAGLLPVAKGRLSLLVPPSRRQLRAGCFERFSWKG